MRLLAFAGKSVLIAILSLAVGEISLRVYNRFAQLPIFYEDTYNRFRGKPNSFNYDFMLNSLGFKDSEFVENRKEEFRILGIGDSFAFGVVPYEYAYLTILEDLLSEKIGPVEVLNMGIPGTGPKDYLSLLVSEGLVFRPDLVLVSFFIGNDLIESAREGSKRGLYSYSYVASLIRYVLSVRPKYQGVVHQTTGEYRDDRPSMSHFDYVQMARRRSYIYIESLNRLPKLVEDALYYLSEAKRSCDRYGISMLVVLIPDELQLRPGLQRAVKNAYKKEQLRGAELDITRPIQLLSAGLQKEGIDYIDLYEPFLNASEEQRLYIPYDSHWNIAGNRLAAELIAHRVTREHFGGSDST